MVPNRGGKGTSSSHLSHDLLAIKMKLRASTVMQRPYARAESIGKGGQICASNSSNLRGISPSSMQDEKLNEDFNNNNSLDNLEERLGLDGLGKQTQVTSHERAHNSHLRGQLPANAYSSRARRKRLVEPDADCTIAESQQSTSSCHVPDSTTCYCGNDYVAYHAATDLSRADKRHSPLLLKLAAAAAVEPSKVSRYPPVQPVMSLGELNGRKNANTDKHMPWFGVDVGGTLTKVVFFDPLEATKEELVTLRRIRRYLKSSKAYGTTGKRDAHLEMSNCVMNNREGSLHFIRFSTSQMPDFLAMAKDKKLAETIDRVCATGGGANKFEDEIRTNLGIRLNKSDELDSVIYGIHYIDKYNSERECYFLEDPLDDAKCVKVPYDFSQPYPYLVVNIGSGVSILAVYSSTSYSRVSGSSIGGGTFLGLCSLLTHCETFEEAIQLAEAGTSDKCNKKVEDIYGGDYTKFNLSGDTVASHFGHMHLKEKHKEVTRADVARALLEMVTTNIGSIAKENAVRCRINRVVFVGNFLRVNQLSMKLLSYALNYWSKGAIKAMFLEHEGYFGAVGCFVRSTRGY